MSISSRSVGDAFVGACVAELETLKPGNVHVYAPGHGMTVEDFVRSAHAAAPALAARELKVGRRIHDAVRATREAVGQNTNLGVVLLAAPLAQAALRRGSGAAGDAVRLRSDLALTLRELDVEDADWAFRAILLASPGGLGDAEASDVRGPARVSLLEAMGEARGRDRIARAYVTDFEDIFTFGLPRLEEARARWREPALAVAYLYMSLLAAFPDTHITRKFGPVCAESVALTGALFLDLFEDASRLDEIAPDLLELDAALKSEGLNPGTTADLTVATLFASALIHGENP